MNHRPAPITLFSGAHSEWQELQRRMRDMQDKRSSLLTHRDSREFAESTSLPVFADEGDELPKLRSQHRKDSKVAIAIVWLIAFCAVFALLKLKFGW